MLSSFASRTIEIIRFKAISMSQCTPPLSRDTDLVAARSDHRELRAFFAMNLYVSRPCTHLQLRQMFLKVLLPLLLLSPAIYAREAIDTKDVFSLWSGLKVGQTARSRREVLSNELLRGNTLESSWSMHAASPSFSNARNNSLLF